MSGREGRGGGGGGGEGEGEGGGRRGRRGRRGGDGVGGGTLGTNHKKITRGKVTTNNEQHSASPNVLERVVKGRLGRCTVRNRIGEYLAMTKSDWRGLLTTTRIGTD